MAFSEQEKILLEKRLKNYTEKVVRFLERLEAESGETFVPYVSDMALTWALHWFETLPFPLASILRAWQATPTQDFKTKYEHLLHSSRPWQNS